MSGRTSQLPGTVLTGLPGSPGVAMGPVVLLDADRAGIPKRHIPSRVVEDEIARFDVAVTRAVEDLKRVASSVSNPRLKNEAGVLEAYSLMLADPSLREDVERRVRLDRQCVEWAIDESVNEMADQLQAMGDRYLAERSHDFLFIGDLLQRALNRRRRSTTPPTMAEPSVIVARHLSPAETAGLDKSRVLGLVTEAGTRTSHTAILARALEIPAVVGVDGLMDIVGAGDTIIVDGLDGTVTVSPDAAATAEAERKAAAHLHRTKTLHSSAAVPARTRCGTRLTIRANIELPEEAKIAHYEGAEGIGLYRTEFLYVNRGTLPTEDEQVEIYRDVLSVFGDQQVTLRTFDLGADKIAAAIKAKPESNPALGLRAVRLALSRPELFVSQLRAMIRASAFGSVRIMVPMVSTLSELEQVRHLFDEALGDVDRRGLPRAPHIPLGAMIEVPAAAIMARTLTRHAEFFSVGTNDLVQYALAVDRGSRRLAHLASHFDPAVLRLVSMVIEAGREKDVPVSVCGAMASDPLAAMLLVGLGLRELSMEASAIAETKLALGQIDLADAEAAARACLEYSTAGEVLCAAEDSFAAVLPEIR